jgi:hypothetical protein
VIETEAEDLLVLMLSWVDFVERSESLEMVIENKGFRQSWYRKPPFPTNCG